MATKYFDRIPFEGLVGMVEGLRDRLVPRTYTPSTTLSRYDYVIAGLAAAIAAAIAYVGASLFDPPALLTHLGSYFSADSFRILASMTDRLSFHHHRVFTHPIFSITVYPVGQLMMAAGIQPLQAAMLLLSACAAASGAFFYLALRALSLPMLAAASFTGALISSAAFIHWFSFIETFSYSTLTMILMIYVLMRASSDSLRIWTLASAGSLAFLTLNWIFAVGCSFFRLKTWDFVRISAIAFAAITFLSVVQNLIFPNAKLFFNPFLIVREYHEEMQFNTEADGFQPWTPAENLRSTLVSTVVAPPPMVEEGVNRWGKYVWANNTFTPMSAMGTTALAAVGCWLFIFGVGLWGAWRNVDRRAVSIPIVAFAGLQVALYSSYGEIPFLYSANVVPLLIAIAAFSWFTPLRYVAVGAAILLTALAGPNNYQHFKTSAELVNEIVETHPTPEKDTVRVPGISAPWP
jgi:hypothetical protein